MDTTTFPFSMDCTKEQYEEIKPLLENMGYTIYDCKIDGIFINNCNGLYRHSLVTIKARTNSYKRTYIGKFNKELLLALCALDSNNDCSKWYKCIKASDAEFTQNNLYKCIRNYLNAPFALIDDLGECNGFARCNNVYFTPATPQEIINHLKEKEDMDTTKQISPEELLKSKKFYIRGNEERYSEIEEIFRKAEASNINALSYKRDDCFYFIDKSNSVTYDECYSEKSWLLQQVFTEYKLPEKPKEYTMDEIAKALGIKVEELKIKK